MPDDRLVRKPGDVETDQALRESEARYRTLVECLPAVTYTAALDEVSTTLYVSPQIKTLLGYTPEEYASDPNIWDESLHPQDRDGVLAKVAHTHRSGEPFSAEYRLIHRDGRVRWCHDEGVVVRDQEGKPLYFQGVMFDITEGKQSEAERERLATAIQQVAEAIVITDAEGTIEYVNPAFETITGYTPREAIGQNPRMLRSGKHDLGFYRQLWDTIKGGNVWSGRFINMRKSGDLYEEEATISPVSDASGRILNFVAVKRDVSEQVLLERRLRQAQKMEAIGTLAGGIAHDFNNVLAAIIGYGQIAHDQLSDDSPLRSDLDRVLAAADRAKDLVRQILAFSRSGEEVRRPTRLYLIVKEALKLLRSSLPATIEIRQDLERECDPVLADPTQVHQIVMNLCTNAYQAMREQGGILTVILGPFDVDDSFARTHPNLHKGQYVRLSVSDTGHGMDEATRERIFEPFFTTRGLAEGTGLGLATVHGIATAHGGAVTVYSEPGEGTTFHVYLPGVASRAADKPLQETVVAGGSERILIVDDEEELAQLLERALKQLGYDAISTKSSLDALQTFRAHPQLFDLVITDQTMPKMTGAQLARELLSIRPDIPIILTTGFSETVSKEKVCEARIRAFLMKPATVFDIGRCVREVLDAHKAAQAQAQPDFGAAPVTNGPDDV